MSREYPCIYFEKDGVCRKFTDDTYDEGEPIDERIWGNTVVVCADYYDGGFTW